MQKIKILKFKGAKDKLHARIYLFRQSPTKYSKKSKKIERNWAGQENFDIPFATAKSFFVVSIQI